MNYGVAVDEVLADRLLKLSTDDLAVFAGLLGELTIDPWGLGSSPFSGNSGDPMRVLPFGSAGMVVYLIDEAHAHVDVADIVAL